MQGLKVELHTLAHECKGAPVELGAETSSHPELRKATFLCEAYLESSRKRKQSSLNQKMDTLWKSRDEQLPGALTGTAAATAMLGPVLVDTITEKHKQPADVRFSLSLVTLALCIHVCAFFLCVGRLPTPTEGLFTYLISA